MKLLVIGSGGREHALAKKFLEDDKVTQVFCAKGNPGMKKDGITLVDIPEDDHSSLIAFAQKNDVAWTFVGPEIPLANGIVDDFQQAGLKIFGPDKAAAQIEGSKDFAKKLMDNYKIPTAAYATFTDLDQAKKYVEEKGAPIVIKADGLAAGKGVVVALDMATALEALEDMLEGNKFGQSGSKVVVEDFLEGEEFSLLAFVRNEKVYPMVISQDHKRAYDGDLGPNTGGMGAYSPVPQISKETVDLAIKEVLLPAASGMVANGTPFTGILYAGLIASQDGPKVIEFNARFGDPETQVVLPRLESSLVDIITNLLADKEPLLAWNNQVTLGVVLAAEGYPGTHKKGMILPDFKSDSVNVYYAGVAENQAGKLTANGGRILLLQASGESLEEAQAEIYGLLAETPLEHMFYRKDIGFKAQAKNL
ncbi:phosphoribosylamine--glycine ligase [Streptococcaceae bacterium ESL0729]|nr:phosphoribosylamine--glycine ligase [Streptococcaceae bacterium ESL0729]